MIAFTIDFACAIVSGVPYVVGSLSSTILFVSFGTGMGMVGAAASGGAFECDDSSSFGCCGLDSVSGIVESFSFFVACCCFLPFFFDDDFLAGGLAGVANSGVASFFFSLTGACVGRCAI